MNYRRNAAIFLSLLLLSAFPASGAERNPFIYAKTVLKILPKAEPEPVEELKDSDKVKADPQKDGITVITPDPLMPKLKRVPKEFTVEVRPHSFLHQKDFIAHQPFADREGMLILIDPPAVAQVTATRMIASADVLFADNDGIIIKIAPSLKLSELTEPVESGRPIHAFIYLKAGTAESSDIRPGDRIENRHFKTHPVVIQ